MVKIVEGDLLKSDCDVIIHQCNCFATQGAGIAKQISSRWAQVLEADKKYPIPVGSKERLGEASMASVEGDHGDMLVVNLYAQHRYGRGTQTDYDALRKGISKVFFMIYMLAQPNIKIGLPYGMGAGLAGGDWEQVKSIIEENADRYKLNVYLYKL